MALKLPDRWIWDSWYVQDGDTYHAFYLCASRGLGDPNRRHRWPSIGHAISTDLKNWTVVADALTPSESPAFDSWTTWTGSVVKADDGKWWMFYTGSSREDGGLIQAIGAATSDDLINWTKLSSDPLVQADGKWYELLDLESWGDQAWRDPWVYRMPGDDDRWHMLITARSKQGQPRTRGVVGHAVSSDLRNWKVLEPLSAPDQGYGQYEVFQYAEVDGVPLLTFCCGWRELGAEKLAEFGHIDTTYSLVVNRDLSNLDFAKAKPFTDEIVYAGRLVQGPDGGWNLIGFINEVDGNFVGELSDPIPVTADPLVGLVRRH